MYSLWQSAQLDMIRLIFVKKSKCFTNTRPIPTKKKEDINATFTW